MRRDFIISAAGHAVVIACVLVLYANPRLFQVVPTKAIEVDIVASQEVPEKKPKPAKEETKQEQPGLGVGPAASLQPQGQPRPQQQAAPQPPQEQPQPAPQPQQQVQQTPQPQQEAPQPAQPQQQLQPVQPTPQPQQQPQQQALLQPQQQPLPQPQPPQPPAKPSIFDPSRIMELFDIAQPSPAPGFDTPAGTTARLTGDEVTQFKTHLKKCWKPPAALVETAQLKAVLRVFLQRDGTLAGQPMLISAPASARGPVLVQTAMRALKECAPYAFLPADRYNEWKVLDLNFSHAEMAGG